MSCNPAIGGVAKGQIVREIDALGGLMGRAIDATGIQFRMLNRRKGPAMHSPRAQADKKAYQQEIKRLIEEQPGLALRQEVGRGPAGRRTRPMPGRQHGRRRAFAAERFIELRAVVAHHRHLPASIDAHRRGRRRRAAEPAREPRLASAARSCGWGFELRRFKTGTPPRLNGRTIDYEQTEIQPGDDDPQPFSFLTDRLTQQQVPCWITYTNEAVHELIRANLHRAPMYTRTDPLRRSALLPFDRRQGRPFRRQGAASTVPRARRTGNARSLRQRRFHQLAARRAGRTVSA